MYVIKSNRQTNSYTVRKINRITQVVRVGRRGLQGETGATGPQGPKGDQGDPATNLVQSVNGKQGVVVLTATDVGADPTGSAAQALVDAKAYTDSESAQALQDAKDYTDTEVSTLDSSLATVAKTGSYNDLSNKPTIPSIAGLATETYVNNAVAPKANTADLGTAAFEDVEDLPVSTATQSALDGKVSKVTTVNTLYGVNGSGNQASYLISQSSDTSSIAQRSSGGTLAVGTPTASAHATTKAYVDAADALKLNIADNRVELRGVGFPNGVVSAPVGSTYIDTNATNGAIEWKKATGTGNTGWVVSVGDTGRRNITSLIPTSSTTGGSLYIRRKGDTVHLSAINLYLTDDGSTVPNTTIIENINSSLGAGFNVPENTSVVISVSTNTLSTLIALSISKNSTTAGIRHLGAKGTRYWSASWNVLEDWPSTLPGTAA